ncbi:hypothetical protein [Abyssicoccus albus]|uniref:hypothetical protein n=1 Tax=Abyssicoccus albus TaxID=1817405 RepID=UPI00097E329B|nr:hypothetical protein [Abyssicoccus albus]AQL56410.1 hypothetical protein BVH56_05490 [Abyssicoccus albus]
MINIFDRLHDVEGKRIEGRTKLFVKETDTEGNILEFGAGIGLVPTETGTLFIIDDYVVDQVDKLKMVDGQLIIKDGMSIDVPEKTEEQLEIEALEKRLAELKS